MNSLSGHSTSYEVKRVFFLNFSQNRDRPVGLVQRASLAETHQLICNMTYLGHHMTSRDLDLRSNFDINFLGQHAYISTRLDGWNTMVSEIFQLRW